MNETNCETVMMANMAEMDGEDVKASTEQINSHLTACENCQREIERMRLADNLFKRQARREQNADLWSAIEMQLGEKSDSQIGWKPFVLLGAALVAYKLLEMLPRQDFGLAFKLVPLVFVVALFVFLKENPFKINAELAQGEIKL